MILVKMHKLEKKIFLLCIIKWLILLKKHGNKWCRSDSF